MQHDVVRKLQACEAFSILLAVKSHALAVPVSFSCMRDCVTNKMSVFFYIYQQKHM